MKERDRLNRRIRICKAIFAFQVAIVLVSMVAVWNPPDMHRHLFNVLWYASLPAHTALALILGKRVSNAKEGLDRLNNSVDS
jgi:hypothetical protein